MFNIEGIGLLLNNKPGNFIVAIARLDIITAAGYGETSMFAFFNAEDNFILP